MYEHSTLVSGTCTPKEDEDKDLLISEHTCIVAFCDVDIQNQHLCCTSSGSLVNFLLSPTHQNEYRFYIYESYLG
jgi:hypothetical protein